MKPDYAPASTGKTRKKGDGRHAAMQARVRQRKQERLRKGCLAAGLMLLMTVLVSAVGLALHVFVIERYFPPETPSPVSAPEQQAELTAKPEQEPDENPEPEPEPETQPESETEPEPEPQPEPEPEVAPRVYSHAQETEQSQQLDLQMYSEAAILVDVETNTVLAEKNADARIYPASMTKIMTALIACESITDWDETYTMTQEIIDRYYLADATMAGFLAGEAVTMEDLLYGAVLPSGAEATHALADVIAGSEEQFAVRMNQRAQELGLTDTHFVDASGLHNDEQYTTVRDMAVILQAALDNERCRAVLSTARHTSASTAQNPSGVEMINKFLVRAESQELSGAQIISAKTGYTAEAMNCCASLGQTPDGQACICVTAKAWTSWYALYDHIAMYTTYAGAGSGEG